MSALQKTRGESLISRGIKCIVPKTLAETDNTENSCLLGWDDSYLRQCSPKIKHPSGLVYVHGRKMIAC